MSVAPAKRYKHIPKYKMVSEEFAKSQAQNEALSLSDRLFWLAMWQAKPNGHATFEDGKIAEILGTTQRSVRRARKEAIDRGYLHSMSDANCLVLPANAVSNRRPGWNHPCPHCMGLTPSPSTQITQRDHDSELLDRESYRRETKAQARAVKADQIGPLSGPNRSPCATRSIEGASL